MSSTTNNKVPLPEQSGRLLGRGLVVFAVLVAIATVVILIQWSSEHQPILGSEPNLNPSHTRTGLVLTAQNRGQVLFGRYCDSCHTGGNEFTGPSLRSAQYKVQNPTIAKITNQVRKGGFDMPAFSRALLPDEELELIAQYILSLPEDKPTTKT